MDEAQAVERWQRGDPEGLKALVRAYELRALRTAYLILRDRMDAEDAVQNAFLRAWEHRHRFDPRRPFWPWLLRLVLREALRLAGRRDRRLSASSPSFLETEDPVESTWGGSPSLSRADGGAGGAKKTPLAGSGAPLPDPTDRHRAALLSRASGEGDRRAHGMHHGHCEALPV